MHPGPSRVGFGWTESLDAGVGKWPLDFPPRVGSDSGSDRILDEHCVGMFVRIDLDHPEFGVDLIVCQAVLLLNRLNRRWFITALMVIMTLPMPLRPDSDIIHSLAGNWPGTRPERGTQLRIGSKAGFFP